MRTRGRSEDVGSGRRAAGELEGDVLAALWSTEASATPSEVQERLGTRYAYNTVLTVLSRLHEKGLVRREKRGRAYAYRPVMDAAELAAQRMRAALEERTDHAGVLQRFVEALGPEDAQILRNVLRRRS